MNTRYTVMSHAGRSSGSPGVGVTQSAGVILAMNTAAATQSVSSATWRN